MLYFRGVRFYETDKPPTSPRLMSRIFRTLKGYQIEFHFYKEHVQDHVYKRGQFRRKQFVCYVVQARFPDEMPERLRTLNNLKFFVPKSRTALISDSVLIDQLLSVYLRLLCDRLDSQGIAA